MTGDVERKPRSMGSHQSAAAITTTWLTPPEITAALGGAESFCLDPCAAPAPRPWATARVMNAETDGDGLALDWRAARRVWLNPPYGNEAEDWLAKLADSNNGAALIFARTETVAFVRQVWGRASGLLFLHGRLHFHRPDGVRAKANAGAPSVLCAYGQDDLDRLAAADLDGTLVPLRFARFAMVEAVGGDSTWSEIMVELLARNPGGLALSDAYRYFARHPKAKGRQHWRPQVRKVLQQVGRRVGPATYAAAAARRREL